MKKPVILRKLHKGSDNDNKEQGEFKASKKLESWLTDEEKAMVKLLEALSSLNHSLQRLNFSMSGSAGNVRESIVDMAENARRQIENLEAEDQLSFELKTQALDAIDNIRERTGASDTESDLQEKEEMAISYGWVSESRH